MVEPFDEILARTQQQLSAQQERERQQRQREAALRTTRSAETSQTIAAALHEARVVAAELSRQGRAPNVFAITSGIASEAWGKRIGKPVNKGLGGRSQRQIERNADKSRTLQQSSSFGVWDLETGWIRTVGVGEDESRITERNYLGQDGTVYHSPSQITDEGFVVVRTLINAEYDLERFSSVRNGLANLVVRQNLRVNFS